MSARTKKQDKSSYLKLIDEHIPIDLNEIHVFFSSFPSTMGQFGACFPQIEELLKTPDGAPVGQSIIQSLTAISQVTQKMRAQFQETSNSLNATVEGVLTSLLQTWNDKARGKIPRTIDTLMKVHSIDDVISNLLSRNQETATQFAMLTAKIMQTPSPTPAELKQYQNAFGAVQTARKKLAKQRQSLIETTQKSVDQVDADMYVIATTLEQNNRTLNEIFNWVGFTYSDLATKLIADAAILKQAAEEIDFSSDFTNFVEKHKIVRYDMRPIPFEAVDTSGPAFEGLDTKIPIDPTPMYPIAMARVTVSFHSGGGNEMTVTKGKTVLLMEDTDLDWTYVMSPMTHRMGFVPSYLLEKVSTTLAIMLREPKASDVMLHVGDFVAILDGGDPTNYSIENVLGQRGLVSKANVGIIFS